MGIMTENHMTAEEYANQRAAYYTPNQPFIKATEVLEETEKRCGAGQQYTTFSEQISDEEKAKVEAKGYTVTRNYVQSRNRDGAPASDDGMYIGFQVALNAIAASGHRPMQISEEEDNGISSGGGGGGTVDQVYNPTSQNAQSGTALAHALGTIPTVTVDQVYNPTSANAQSGVAMAGVIGDINSVLDEVL